MPGQGRNPFRSAYLPRGRCSYHKKTVFGDRDHTDLTMLSDFTFKSSVVPKTWPRYWDGTKWVNLDIGYTPVTPGHWNGSPANVSDALDRLASAVYILRGNVPIP